MSNETVKQILMRRDKMEEWEADKRIEEVQFMIWDCVDQESLECAEDVLREELGLEPDYLDEFIGI